VKQAFAFGVVALFLFGVLAAAFGLMARGDRDTAAFERPTPDTYRGSEPPGVIRLPSFALRDYTGEVVRSRDLRGKVVVITFLDSQCTESCPVIASQVGRTVDLLASSERGDVEAMAISTDPAEDTTASVHRFLRRQRAVGKLRYLTRPEQRIRSVWKPFLILSSLESGRDTLHSASVRVYDRDGIWVSTLHPGVDLTPANLAHDIRAAQAT
jgi:cytochrome oxidase Cu insertion factor (SCO1/SenC/PrrC family)